MCKIKGLEKKFNVKYLRDSRKQKDCHVYKLECGHEQIINTSNALYRDSLAKCKTCAEIADRKFFRKIGIKLIEKLPNSRALYQCNKCGSIMNIRRDKLNAGIFACQSCEDIKIRKEAEENGLELIRKGNSYRNLYRFKDCGHLKMIKQSDVRIGKFCCQQCNSTYHNKPSKLYIVKIFNEKTLREWIKLGIAKNVDQRIKLYGLSDDSKTTILEEKLFETHREAYKVEQAIHNKHKEKKLCKDLMLYYMSSGNTECYPFDMLDTLKSEIMKKTA